MAKKSKMLGFCGVYEIVNLVTHARYIGSTINTYRRWGNHRRELRRGINNCRGLQEAWTRTGENLFEFHIIEMCSAELLKEREQYWLDERKASFEVYNLCPRTDSLLGYKMPEDLKQKLKEEKPWVLAIRSMNMTEINKRVEVRRKRSEAMKIRSRTPEAIARSKKNIEAVNNNPEMKEKLRQRLRIYNQKVREAKLGVKSDG